jgi:protein-S-isoprenylcysteine O-methyltransferase Ste14
MKSRAFLVIAVFAAFTVYSATVIASHGYTGFMEVAMAGGWGTQVFIDLCIALLLFAIWMFGDARERGIPAWPYFIAILFTGSIGALAYLVHRALKEANTQTPHPATG